MTRDYSMDDFHAEMRRRGVHERPIPRTRAIRELLVGLETLAQTSTREHCTTCDGTNFVDAIDNDGQPYRGCKRCRIAHPEDVLATIATGNTLTGAPAREHAPRISLDLTRVLGCTCGWRTPCDVTDSDTAFTCHAAIARIVEGGAQ